MPRLLPDKPYICYFCSTEYVLSSYVEIVTPYKRVGRMGPKNCPCCTAPTLLGVRPSAQSAAKDLVALYYNTSSDSIDTPQTYLERMYVDVQSIDACLAEIPRIDFAKWESGLQRADLTDPDTFREVTQEMSILPQAHKDIINGTLATALQPSIDAAKRTIEQQRVHWKSMYEQNCENK